MERDIKKENAIIGKVVEKANEMFQNGTRGYTDFLELFGRIKNHIYSFYKDDGICGGIMVDFNNYLDGFENTDSGDRKCREAINHFINEVYNGLPW